MPSSETIAATFSSSVSIQQPELSTRREVHQAIIRVVSAGVLMSAWTISTAHGESVSAELALAPPAASVNQLEITISLPAFGGASDTDTTNLSGNALADFDVDVSSGDAVITGITFTGGSIRATDVSFALLLGQVTVVGTGMGGTPNTPLPPGSVEPGGLQFAAAEHQLAIDRGIVRYAALGNVGQVDLAQSPVQGSGTGWGKLRLTEVGSLGARKTYEVTTTLPIQFTDVITNDPTIVQIDVAGNVVGTGRFTVALPADFGDIDGDGDVDDGDLSLLLSGFAEGGPYEQVELEALLSNFGRTDMPAPLLGDVQSVPEPSTGVLVVIALLTVGLARRKSRRSGILSSSR